MVDRLSMSLEEIIDQTEAFNKVRKNEIGNKPVKSSSSFNQRKVGKFDNKRPYSQNSYVTREVAERPMKIVTRERPKLITPETVNHTLLSSTHVSTITAASAPAVSLVGPASSISTTAAKANHASVFNRLGSTGTYVLFNNLKRSVEEADIIELCRAVGEIKDIKFTINFPGNNYARVLFAYERDATACVAKYNGLTLDGEEMRVMIDNVQSQIVPTTSSTVFSRIESAAKFPSNSATFVATPAAGNDSNIRAGLFGTALQTAQEEGSDNNANQFGKRNNQKVIFQTKSIGKDRTVQYVNATNRRNGDKNAVKSSHNRRPVNKKSTNNSNDMTTEDLDNDLDDYLAQR